MNNVAALTEEGAFALFFWSPPRRIWQLKSPHRREFAIQGKKNANARGSVPGGRGWAQLELRKTLLFSRSDKRQDFAWNRQQTEWNIEHKLSPSYLQKPANGSMPLEPAETRPISNFP